MSIVETRREAVEPKRVGGVDAPVVPSTPEIAYERQPPGAVPRWWLRLIALLLLLNVVATTSISWGPAVVESARRALAERRAASAKAQADAAAAAAEAATARRREALQAQAAAYVVPAGQVVYTEDPREAKRLLTDEAGYAVVAANHNSAPGLRIPHPAVRWEGPAELEQLVGSLDLPRHGATAFLHERRTPSGRRVIVWAAVETGRDVSSVQSGDTRHVTVGADRRLVTWLVHAQPSPRDAWRHVLSVHQPDERKLKLSFDPGPKPGDMPPGVVTQRSPVMRVLAGRADPKDATHFELEYTIDGRPGTIDGWVREDGRLRIEPRQGVKTVQKFDSDGVETWDPHATAPERTLSPKPE